MPDSCAAAPLAQNCATGSHWTLIGSGIAHCVQDDPVCPWSTSLTHDSQGNPSCEQNTCPANQVLQIDGKSCACPTGTSWNGSTCVTQVCTADSSGFYRACSNGADASEFVIKSVNCPFGPYGPAVSNERVDDADCKASADPAPAPGCTAGTTYEEANCDTGTGKKWRGLTTYCPGGASGYPSSYYSDWHTESCGGTSTPSTPSTPTTTDPSPTPDPVPACTVTTSTNATSCGTGYTGTKYVTVKQLCPSGTSSSEDTSGCGCANGATDYPTCSPVPAPEPDLTKTCKTISRVVQTDTSIGCGGSVSTTTTTAVERQTFSACTYSDGTYTETRIGGTDYGVKNCRTGIVTWY
jgi:hypothetical protein